jgi:uncharacterized protein YqeY
MTLRNKIESDIIEAMRSRDQGRLDALRFLKSVILAAEKSRGETLDEESLLQVITKQVNDRRESIRMFQEGNRQDLVAKESAELAVLQVYLPPQLSQEELTHLVCRTIEEVGAATVRDKGRVMGRLMPQVRGKADGAEVNALVEEILASAG